MKSAVLKTLGSVNTLTLALGVGMALVAEPATIVLLGEKWRSAIPYVALFSLVGALKISVGPLPTMLLVLGQSQLQARIV